MPTDLDLVNRDLISHSYDPGFIVLSYLVSLAGCWTSIELLNKRTGSRGYYNWYVNTATYLQLAILWTATDWYEMAQGTFCLEPPA